MKKIDFLMIVLIIISLLLSDYATTELAMPNNVQLAILGLIVLVWFIIRLHMFLKKYSD